MERGGKPPGLFVIHDRSDATEHRCRQPAHVLPRCSGLRFIETHGITAVHALEGGRIFGDEGVMPILISGAEQFTPVKAGAQLRGNRGRSSDLRFKKSGIFGDIRYIFTFERLIDIF